MKMVHIEYSSSNGMSLGLLDAGQHFSHAGSFEDIHVLAGHRFIQT